MREFRILTVCTANICRSPAFATLLHGGTSDHPGLGSERVFTSSVGLMAADGRATDPAMIGAMSRVGVHLPDSPSRRASEAKFDEADLILAATRRHRSAIVRGDVTLRDRTFTYREFARFCAAATPRGEREDAVECLARLVAFAVEQRGQLQPRRAEDDDVQDPFGRSRLVYRSVSRQLKATAETILAAAGPRA